MTAVIWTAYLGYAVLAWLVLVWAFRPFWEDRPERYTGRRRLRSHRLGWVAEVVYAVHSNRREGKA